MKLAKRLWYKLIIILCVIATLSSFIASAPVYASKVNKTDFYYSGTSKGSYTVGEGFLSALIATLEAILDYLLGLCTMGFRMVFVGWTALFERCLTLIILGAAGEENIDMDAESSTNLFSTDGWITLDAIFFNHVALFDINFFNMEMIEGYDPFGSEKDKTEGTTTPHTSPSYIYTEEIEAEEKEVQGTVETKVVQGQKKDFEAKKKDPNKKSLVIILKETVAGWYYVLRLMSIMAMLVLLMYIGIKMAIQSSATDRAVYKKMLVDWVVGMIFVFFIHYIMLFIITVNETLVQTLEGLRTGTTPLAVYEYGLEERAKKPITNEELELTLYDEVKTRAYDIKMAVGTTGMIMYMVLVYYAWKYSFIYLKRYLTVAVLVIMAPLVAVSYAYNKVRTGKSTIFSKWFKEFIFIVLLQSIHALIYLVFVQTALAMSLASISGFIISMVMLNFMCKAEDIFRKIFGINGALTNDIAEGAGLRDTLNGLKSAMGVMAVGKVAKTYTKGFAKVLTKPAAFVGDKAFVGIMKHRGRRLDEEAISYGQKVGDKSIKSYSDMKKHKRKARANTLHMGEILKGLEDGTLDIDELEAEVDSLHEGDSLYDANDTMIGTVTSGYIKKRRKELDEIKSVAAMSYSAKNNLRDEYNKLHNKKGEFRGIKLGLGDKLEDIFDPSQYVRSEMVKDKKGKTALKYKAIERRTEYGEAFGKKFGKTVDSASTRLAKNLKLSNIFGLNKEEKKALEQQAALIKSELTGFMGIFMGIPLLVAQPKAGMVSMSVGIQGASAMFSGAGKARKRDLSHFSMDAQGNYVFNRFEGKSEHTIAEGAKIMATRQANKIATDRIAQDEAMKARVNAKYPKLSMNLKRVANRTAALGAVTAGVVGGLPVLTTAVAVGAVGNKLTGSILKGRFGNNAWARYQDTMRAIKKSEAKAIEKDEKAAGTANFFSDKYFETESDQLENDAKRHADKFADAYGVVLDSMQEEINKKSEEELQRDAGYEEPIEVTTTPEGKKQISLDSENKLIDDALIEYAQKSGIMDVAEVNVEDKMDDIERIIKTDLVTRGIIQNDQEISEVIENLSDRVKDRQVQIEKSGQGKKVVEDKMAGDAIISVMQDRGITDPSAVSDEEVLARFAANYQAATADTMQSSQKSNSVLESLNAQKADGSEPKKAFDIEKVKESAKGSISARKASFADKAKQGLEEQNVNAIKQTLKRKKEIELDDKILRRQEALQDAGSAVIANEFGGVAADLDGSVEVTDKSSSKVVDMLFYQTELYKDKKKKEYVDARIGKGTTEKSKAMEMGVHDTAFHGGDGSRALDSTKDGSRKVPTDSQTITDISDLIKKKKQELRV